jgi:hypothetical protein
VGSWRGSQNSSTQKTGGPLAIRLRLASVMAKKLRCYLGWHLWQKRRGDDGAMYYECRNCGKGRGPYYPAMKGDFINPP